MAELHHDGDVRLLPLRMRKEENMLIYLGGSSGPSQQGKVFGPEGEVAVKKAIHALLLRSICPLGKAVALQVVGGGVENLEALAVEIIFDYCHDIRWAVTGEYDVKPAVPLDNA